jgi:integrase
VARTVRDAKLNSRAKREELEARGKPYWREIEQGLHLGYRRLTGRAGTWCVRHYLGNQKYQNEAIGAADDYTDADGVAILNFKQAQDKARERLTARAQTAAGNHGPLTVSQAMERYLKMITDKRKSAATVKSHIAHITPTLGAIEVAALTTDQITDWHTSLAKSAPLARAGAGKPRKARQLDKTEDGRRARRGSANRALTTLKAALNMLWREGKVPSDAAWRRVEPFEDVDVARARYLTIDEAKRLTNACDGAFRKLVQAALQTGARYGELIALEVRDFNPDVGTLAVRQSKSSKPRQVVLTDEGAALFKQVCAGRPGSEVMFKKPDGGAWKKTDQARPMKAACKAGQIKPPIGIHGMRHTWASHAVMNGVPLLVVAKNLGHSDTRMVEKHYGHLGESYITEAIRAGAPKFGFKPDPKVKRLDAHRHA